MTNNKSGLSEIVKSVCCWIEGFIFLFGCYIVLFGHLTPGGGFAGGVIMAASFILIMLSFGKERTDKLFPRTRTTLVESFGALLFIAVAWLGIYYGGGFFANFLHQKFGGTPFTFLSGGTIPISNVAIALKVMAGLFLVFYVLSTHKVILDEDISKTEKDK
ncbi:hypothetical protein KAI78_10430 [bacterium]|nr:hypothetical protein [bacterium]